MNRILKTKNDILVEEIREIPADFGENQAKKDIDKFEENLIEIFNNNEEDLIFEKRTLEALERVESRSIKGMTKSQFLNELDSW
ncbi:hypothetical protein [uncultured Methanobrevibacter sp.]|uniref:hypothetical protein n=1 Tax=uncultured Methanobrevibacter sp. TaxID=253161 RepID=UPI0025EF7850|nr:hypothetical protein [uncultured Methanobrevibacter sp.]